MTWIFKFPDLEKIIFNTYVNFTKIAIYLGLKWPFFEGTGNPENGR
jgi:hypothetical protein